MQKIELIKNKNYSDEKNVNSFNNSIYDTDYKVFSSSFSSQSWKQSLVISNDENKLISTFNLQSAKYSCANSIQTTSLNLSYLIRLQL